MATAQDNWPPDTAAQRDDMPTVVVTVVMTLVATIFISLRLYGCVYILRRRLYLEEWLSVINQIDLWLTAALVIYLYSTTGAGRHWATLSAAERTQAVFWNNVLTAPLLLGLGLPKLTVVSLLTRVFKPGRLHRAAMWSMAILCVISFVVAILLIWLSSPPAPASSGVVGRTAAGLVDSWAYVKFCYFAATFSSAVDLYFALYPGFVFRNLGWDTKKKVVLSGVMGLGICATAASIYKIMTLSVFAFDDDFTYQLSQTIIPTVVEANTIMIAASISTMHPVYEQVRRKLKSWTGNDGGDAAQRRHHHHQNVDDTPQAAKLGFWSMMMGRCGWTDSNTFVSRRSRSHSYIRRGPASSRTPRNAEMSEVPTRTLEDARDHRGPEEEGHGRGARADKALVRLYHAGLGADAGC